MHILIIPSWYPRDENDISGSFFREQSIALARRGCNVGVISLQLRLLQNLYLAVFDSRRVSHSVDEDINTYRQNGIKWFPFFPGLHAIYCRYYGMKLFERYSRNHGRPDLIHVQSMVNAGVIAEAIYKKHGIPYVVTEHSSSLGGRFWFGKINSLRAIARGAKRRFAVSSGFAQLLGSALGESVGTWEVMPNIVDDSFLSYAVTRHSKDCFSFINVSLLSKNKRVDILIRAFAKAFGNNPRIFLSIGGDGCERSSLERLVHNLGLAKQVKFLGTLTREQVVCQVSASDAMVLSSDFETFGVVLIEALALGKPVVSTRCGGPEDIVTEADGILVPRGDPAAMASAMLAIYENHGSYDSEQLRKSCRLRFGERAVTDRLLAVYGETISEGSSTKLMGL